MVNENEPHKCGVTIKHYGILLNQNDLQFKYCDAAIWRQWNR